MSELDKDTLLPDNRTTFERSYEEGVKDLVKGEDVHAWITDPLKTKAELLDLMAKERGVNDWFFSDSEQTKRAITKMAYSVHQASGTSQGIVQACEAVDFSAQITPWHQVEGSLPYTVHVLASGKQNPFINKERAERLIERINHVKSERDSIDISFSFEVSASFAMTAARAPSVNVLFSNAKAELWPPANCSSDVGVAMGRHAGVSVRLISAKAYISAP